MNARLIFYLPALPTYRAALLLLGIGLSTVIKAQNLILTDKETGEKLESVMLLSDVPKAFSVSHANGIADLSPFKGAVEIQVMILGYGTEVLSYARLQELGFKLALRPSGINIEPITISATRWNQRAGRSPEKIMSISPKEVQFQNPQTAADLLGSSGEVFIQKSQQGGGSPMIRGFSANRLLYVVDGVRMNTAIFRGGNLQNVISLDPLMMESTEVMFGPGSVIYGSDAIGGVMNFNTYSPQFSSHEIEVTGKAMNRYSSANSEKAYHVRLNVSGKKLASVTGFSFHDFGNLRMGSHGPDDYLRPFYVQRFGNVDSILINPDSRLQIPSAYSQANFTQKLKLRVSKSWNIDYGFHYSETSPYTRYDREIRYKNGNARYGEWSYGPQVWLMNNLSAELTAEHKLFDGLMLRLAQQHFEESRRSRNLNASTREMRNEEVEAYSFNMDFTKNLGKHNLFYGLESILDQVSSTGIDKNVLTGEQTIGPARYPQADWSSQGIYLTDQFIVSDVFLFSAGMRYTYFKMDAEFDTTFYAFGFTEAGLQKGAPTGSLGFIITPNKNWMISSNFATGFRAPNVDDMGKVFDSQAGAVVVPNPYLGPEYAYNSDFRVMWTVEDVFRIDVSGFYTLLEDALVRRDFQLSGLDSILYDGEMSKVQAIQNAAVSTVYGLQAGMECKLSNNLRFLTRINYQIGEEELDDGTKSPARHAAPWFGMSSVTYSCKRFKVQTALVYNGARSFEDMPFEEHNKPELYAKDKNGDPYSPGWYIWNVKAEMAVNDIFAINVGIDNITNQRYRPYSSGMAGAGTNFILSARLSF
jgi:hemoglobin/transferrin/lactoferrin receptor protein